VYGLCSLLCSAACALICVSCLASASGTDDAPLVRWQAVRPAMGTRFTIVLYAQDEASARRGAEAAFARIAALDTLLTDYDETSALCRLGARSDAGPCGPQPVPDALFNVLSAAIELAQLTAGAFDPTLGPWTKAWRAARAQGVLPKAAALDALAPSVGYRLLRLDEASGTVALDAPGMALDLGGIAKGFALDQALAVLRAHGIERALIDGGGDVLVGAPPPGRRGWRVAIEPFAVEHGPANDPTSETAPVVIELAHAALATSGDSYQSLTVAGQRHSHILDPQSGRALTTGHGASVVAPDATRADALASAACVLTPERALELVAGLDGVELRSVASGPRGEALIRRSAGFPTIRLAD